jgi:malonate transporter and related proteins
VLLGINVGKTFDNSLALLGQAGGGVGLFTTGIVLESQSVSMSPEIVASVVGKNMLTPLALLGISYVAGQGANAGKVAVTASIMAAPIIATLAIEYGVAVREMSSTLLLSALASILTTGAFIVFAT